MRSIDAYASLRELKTSLFRTHDAMARLDAGRVSASTILARLEKSGQLLRLKRGLWAFPDKTGPLAMAEHLTHPFPCYVSLQSALYFHGMVSQIPDAVYVMSPARTRIYRTKLGIVSVHHVNPAFFFGFEVIRPAGFKMATPEKALLDFLYLGPARSNLFRSLPELELPRTFSMKRAKRMLRQAGASRRMSILKKKLVVFAENRGLTV